MMQVVLKSYGYYEGKIDGLFGNASKQALISFQGLNNIDADGYTHQSLQGNKCKVEIISRTKLLRARGFKV